MNAADYFDWYHYSGTGLGTSSPGERFRQLHRELSWAGANVVIAGEFLEHNPDVLDVGRWRRTQVWGLESTQIQLTAEALDAIGARGTAAAVRQGAGAHPGRPTLSELKEGAPADRRSVAEMINDLRERIVARHPEAATNLPADLRAGLPQPHQTEGAETREELVRLLEDYAAAHQEELAADVARYGDPRQAPDFDPQRFLEEQARRSKRLFLLRDQQGEIPLLREKLETLQRRIAADAPDALPVQRERRKVMDEYRRYAKHEPEAVADEIRAWMKEVDQLRERHPEVFRPRPTRNDEINARLAAVGDYRVGIDDESRTVSWSNPPALECDWARFTLSFLVWSGGKGPDPAALDAAFRKLLAEWERFRDRFPELEPELRDYVVGLFRAYRFDDPSDDERAAYEDEQGEIADEKVLASIRSAGVHLAHHHGGGVEVTCHFGVPWDKEHGVEVQFDADGEIQRWF
jgi:hypothetical protein